MHDRVKYNDLQNALFYLSANCDRDLWIKIGTAIKDAFPDQNGCDLFHRWSSNSSDYKQAECEAQWRSFRPGHGNGQVSVGTLFHDAKANGYRPKPQDRNETDKQPTLPLPRQPSKESKA